MNTPLILRITAADLPVPTVSPRLAAAAMAFTRLKAHPCRLLNELQPPGRWLDRIPSGRADIRQLSASVFASKLIPFYAHCLRSPVAEVMRVPARQVIGENSRWHPFELSIAERRAVVRASESAMDNFLTFGDDDREVAQFSSIEGFGLYVAHAGTHRVALYGAYVPEETVPALVSPIDYPSARRLITSISPWGRHAAILDRRWIFPLALPVHQLRLLEAYGVGEADWPENVRCDRHEIEQWVMRQNCVDGEVLPAIDSIPVQHGQHQVAAYPVPA